MRVLVEELSQLQGPITSLVVEQEGNGVREDLPQQPAAQMPEVLGPHPLYGVPSGELRKDGVDPVAKPAQEGTPLWSRIALLIPVRCEELYSHAPHQLFLGLGRVVVAVTDEQSTAGGLDELRYDGKLVGISRGHREAADEPRPANQHVQPEAIEGLPEQHVLAKGRLSAEAFTSVGTSEQACRQGHRVADGEGGVVRGERKELLPEVLRCTSPRAGNHSP